MELPEGARPAESAKPAESATEQAARNELSGVVHGSAVQARSIQGGVHFSVTQAGWAAGMPVPAQLPAAVADFTGRTAELASLDRVATDYDSAQRLTVAVIVGVGGAGKTSLASYWLHCISYRYDGGLLYADLQGHAPDAARPPSDVLTGFLSALGTPPERIPLGLDEQAKLYRSLTSGRRMLVLLDNAASAAQVRALLPGPGPRQEQAAPEQGAPEQGAPEQGAPEQGAPEQGAPAQQGVPSLVVVTTRWRIAGLAMDGARFIELGPLEESAGVELLGRMVGPDRLEAEPGAVRSVVRLCGGLPLAVRVAGARLASRAKWSVGRVAAELAGEHQRLAALSLGDDLSVRAAFDLSYRVLAPSPARLYQLASLIPGPDFSAGLAAATTGVSLDEVSGLLDALTEASLLEETGEGRFRFHDLVRLHARDQARTGMPQECPAALTRAIGWYLTRAVAADIVIIPSRWRLNPMYDQARVMPPGYGGPPQALWWMEAELPGLLAAVRTAHDEGLNEEAWQLCEAMWGLFTYRKYFRPWLDAHALGLASARACGDARAEARMRVQLGFAYLNLGRAGQAHGEFAQALTLARQEGHRVGEATALEHLGLTDLSLGRTDAAIAAFMQAREVFQDIGVRRGVLGVTRHIGEAHRDAGRREQAVEHLLEACRLSVELPDPYNEARCRTSLGQTYLKAAQPDAAARLLGQALDIMISLGGSYEQARIRAGLAEALLQLGRPGQARDHLVRALEVYSGIDAPEAAAIRRRLGELSPPDDASSPE